MPTGGYLATAGLTGTVTPSGVAPARLWGDVANIVVGAHVLTGTVSRAVIESLSGPSIAYDVAVYLDGELLPRSELLSPFEIEESIDTVVVLFSFGLVGRRWSVELTTRTWTRTPVEVWVTSGPIGATRTWLRAFGVVIGCEMTSGPEPTLKIRCADPSTLFADTLLCEEIPAGEDLARGAICTQILEALGLQPDVPDGAVWTKALVTDSRRLWEWLRDFGEPEIWAWRFVDATTVEAYTVALRQPPEPPDDVWTLADIVSIETAPPGQAPSRFVVRSTEVVDAGADLQIKTTRTEVRELYARKWAVQQQQADGSLTALSAPSTETLQTVSLVEVEEHTQAGKLVQQITREWGWYNPRAAKMRSAGLPPGPVESGYYWAQAYIDEDGKYRAWRAEAFVQTGERREVPVYDDDGTETGRRTETRRWYGKAMATRNVGSDAPNVVGAGVGDDGVSWFAFQAAGALLRIEDFGLAQIDVVSRTFDAGSGAQLSETQETQAWYSARTPVAGVPWYVNYSGAGQKDLVAPLQVVGRRTTTNRIDDGHLSGTVETTHGYHAPARVDGAFDYGDGKSNVAAELFTITQVKTTAYNVLDQDSYEEVVDAGDGAERRTVMGRAPRPRYRASAWTQTVQAPLEVAITDATAEAWWGAAAEVVTVDAAQSSEEALAVAQWRRARKLAYVHTVVRPVSNVRPGQTVLLLDPRSAVSHRCLVAKVSERWILAPRPQILATYTLEQPL